MKVGTNDQVISLGYFPGERVHPLMKRALTELPGGRVKHILSRSVPNSQPVELPLSIDFSVEIIIEEQVADLDEPFFRNPETLLSYFLNVLRTADEMIVVFLERGRMGPILLVSGSVPEKDALARLAIVLEPIFRGRQDDSSQIAKIFRGALYDARCVQEGSLFLRELDVSEVPLDLADSPPVVNDERSSDLSVQGKDVRGLIDLPRDVVNAHSTPFLGIPE